MKIFFTVLIVLSTINAYSQVIVIENDSIDVKFPITEYDPVSWDGHYVKENQFGFLFILTQFDFRFNDFGAFEAALGKQNIDFMNRSDAIFTFGIGGTYNKWLAELHFGFLNNNDYKNDSLSVKLNSTKYGISFGYNVVNTQRLIVTPKVSIDWNRYRLINSTKEKVSLEEYVHNRDLDIRFNQLTGFVGLNISYKLYTTVVFSSDYMTVGLYGGYIFQFNEKPWMYSVDKRLINDKKIDLKNYSFGMRFTWNIELK